MELGTEGGSGWRGSSRKKSLGVLIRGMDVVLTLNWIVFILPFNRSEKSIMKRQFNVQGERSTLVTNSEGTSGSSDIT